MKKNVTVVLIVFASLFALMFLGRFVWELGRERNGQGFAPQGFGMNAEIQQSESSASWRKNYASTTIVLETPGAGQGTLDQKYERISDIASISSSFDADSSSAFAQAKSENAIVQEENSRGLAGSRALSLVFGVRPEGFESLVEKLKKIGTLTQVSVTKTDKTADFRALEAKRISLEKTRDGLKNLKVPGAPLADLINLETKILEIEGQIQDTGVSLGDFSETNSFCTVRFSLREGGIQDIPSRILNALLSALEWTTWLYLGIAFGLAFALAAAFLLVLLIEKGLKWKESMKKPDIH